MLPSNCGIIIHYKNSFFDPLNIEENVFYTYEEKNDNKFKLLKKLSRKFDILTNLISFNYSHKWTSRIKSIENWIIVDDNKQQECIGHYIKFRNKKAKIYYCSIDLSYPIYHQKYCDEAFCWDEKASKKWNATFIPLCYYYIDIKTKHNTSYSFLWLGREKKDRNSMLLDNIKNSLLNVFCNSSSYFWKTLNNNDKGYDYTTEYLPMIINTKILIEVVINNQTGLTLRALEALFYNKKLITTNEYIKKYNFYNSNNIFIWGVDSNLSEWIKLPHMQVSDSIKNEYTFESFVKKICKI